VIVDTSALLAIHKGEPDAKIFAEALATAPSSSISAGTLLEASMVVDANRDPVLSGRLDDLVRAVPLLVAPVTADHVQIARQGYRDFGRSSQHPAQLNFGDCFAYALARSRGEPLLFKGNDFGHTDIEPQIQR
jgi:ribonuclease VapC